MSNKWQLIEGDNPASKDGTLILATSVNNHSTYVVGWAPGTGDPSDGFQGEAHWDDVGSKNAMPAVHFNSRFFTHWMPLPSPPTL